MNARKRLRRTESKRESPKHSSLSKRKHMDVLTSEEEDSEDIQDQPSLIRSLTKPTDLCLRHCNGDIIGVGLVNQKNSCYINAVLQCLRYTPPLFNYLQTNKHTRACKKMAENSYCLMCEIKKHFERTTGQSAFFPANIVKNLEKINENLKFSSQGDSHEFLRFVLEGMHNCCIYGVPNLTRNLEVTSIIYRIFGGYLVSQSKPCCNLVLCDTCGGVSNRHELFFDLATDITMDSSLIKGLERFFSPELLTGENSYHCQNCNGSVTASKRMMIDQLPNLLTFQLKRFSYSNKDSRKLNKKVTFEESLNMRPYMTDFNEGKPEMYSLYAVIVHVGNGNDVGHYYSYVKTSYGAWYMANDKEIQVITPKEVMSSHPYLLFYIRNDDPVTLSVKDDFQKNTISPHVGENRSRDSSTINPGFVRTDNQILQFMRSLNLNSVNILRRVEGCRLFLKFVPKSPNTHNIITDFWRSQNY